jgi:hypothetical protein
MDRGRGGGPLREERGIFPSPVGNDKSIYLHRGGSFLTEVSYEAIV